MLPTGHNGSVAHGVSVPTGRRTARRSPKRLLALRADEHLVERLRAGDGAAFEVMYERHVPALLSFCRHMLGTREDAEDAVQHTFTAAHRAILGDEREINLKPWLYSIARNRCLSVLRARREHADERVEPSTDGLDAQVLRRAELQQLVEDLQDLPEEQRAALVLSELRDLSHADVAGVLGCEVANVKGLVFRARAGLAERRDARETPCQAIREELSTARGGALRRGSLRHHLRACPGCTAYLDEVRHQRKMMAVILPVVPTAGLKSGVLAAAGVGGGAAGGGAAGGGLLAALLPGSGATAAKVAIVGAVVAGGGGVAGEAALDGSDAAPERPAAVLPETPAGSPGSPAEATGPDAARPKDQEAATKEAVERERKKLKREKIRLKRLSEGGRGGPAGTPAAGRGRNGEPGRQAKGVVRAGKRRSARAPRRRRARSRPTARVRPVPKPKVLRQDPAAKEAPIPDATLSPEG